MTIGRGPLRSRRWIYALAIVFAAAQSVALSHVHLEIEPDQTCLGCVHADHTPMAIEAESSVLVRLAFGDMLAFASNANIVAPVYRSHRPRAPPSL